MKIFSFLILIRWQNLLILAITQIFFFFFVIRKSIPTEVLSLSILDFLALMLGTVLIAASGNLLNDLYDEHTDSYNKPGKVRILNSLSDRSLINAYYIMNGFALMLGMYFTLTSGNYNVISVFILSAGLLWFYNITLKSLPVVGNLTIAVLCGLSIVIVFLAETSFFSRQIYQLPLAENIERILYLMLGYASFAFLLTWIREMIKDLQDRYGDDQAGYKTLAVLLGTTSKFLISALIGSLIAGLIAITLQLNSVGAIYHTYYLAITLIIPSFILLILLLLAKSPVQYKFCGILVKLLMLFGIASMPVFEYLNKI
ncbi:MAG: UbiA family prenyltransferase [Chitinophagales bacterium]|nr:UbiA family prenyltransferase [Chitinophagales bacterium]